jgi:hypothetical protein
MHHWAIVAEDGNGDGFTDGDGFTPIVPQGTCHTELSKIICDSRSQGARVLAVEEMARRSN